MLEKRTIGTDNAKEVLTRYIYSNHLQSASLELDADANIISYEEYHPYGTTSYQAMNALIKATAKRYRYTGKERDEESGLYYHGARYYIPWLCRWSAVDALESEYAGWSPYNYGNCNPVTFNDPSGMGGEDTTKGIWYRATNKKTGYYETKWDPNMSLNEYNEKYGKDPNYGTAFKSQKVEYTQSEGYIDYSDKGIETSFFYEYKQGKRIGVTRIIDHNKGDEKKVVTDAKSEPIVNSKSVNLNEKNIVSSKPSVKSNEQKTENKEKTEKPVKTEIDKTVDVINSVSLVTSATSSTISRAAHLAKGYPNSSKIRMVVPKTLNWQVSERLSYKNTSLTLGRWNAGTVRSVNSWLKPIGNAAKVAAPLTAVYSIFKDGRLTIGDGYEAAVTGFGIAFPVFGLLYGAVDLGFSLFTNKSLTDRVKEVIDNKINYSIDLK